MMKIESALAYAKQGVPVIPLNFIVNNHCSCNAPMGQCKPGKHPFGGLAPRGLNNATTEVNTIERWWTREPRCNIGIRTGEISGFFVLDVDDRDDGSRSLTDLEEQFGSLPKTLTQITGGGRHLFFKVPHGINIQNSQGQLGKGLDIRGDGGYVVAAPSDHQNGSVYRFDSESGFNRALIVDAPTWLIDLCRRDRVKSPKPQECPGTINQNELTKIKDGEGREGYLLKTAGELRAKGVPQPQIEEMLLALNQAKISPPLNAEIVIDRARRYATPAANDDDWPDPLELGDELLQVEPFNPQLLPSSFQDWVSDTAERMQAPIDYLAVGAMVAVSSVIGNKIGIQPKQSDCGWIEVPNLWGGVVGRPSSMKSPVLEIMISPVLELEKKAIKKYEEERAARQFDLSKYEIDKKAFESKLKKGQANKSDLPLEPKFEPQRRYVVNDTTFQKLGEILKDNPNGVLVFQDELSGLLESVSSQGQEGARGFYLTGWNGRQSYVFDRIGRGTTLIPRLCLSVLGGFQPAKLRQHLGAAVAGGKHDDGMAQRFQLLVFPDKADTWEYVDRPPRYDFTKIEDIFDRLDKLDPQLIGAQCDFGRDIPALRFDDDAQALFVKMLTKLEQKLRSGTLDPALESHLAKYRKLIPSMSLLIHLVDVGHGPIGIMALKKAWGWTKYLESHARRVYAVATGIKDQATRSLISLLESGKLKDGFTARDVYRTSRSGLVRPEDAQEAIDGLVELGWLKALLDPSLGRLGRPSYRYLINPKVRRVA